MDLRGHRVPLLSVHLRLDRASALSLRGLTVNPDGSKHMETLVKALAALMFYGPFAYITAVGIRNTINERNTK